MTKTKSQNLIGKRNQPLLAPKMKIKIENNRPCKDLPHRLVVIYDLAKKRYEEHRQEPTKRR